MAGFHHSLARLAVAIGLTTSVVAAHASGETKVASLASPVSATALADIGGSLVLVVGAVFAVGWLYAKLNGRRRQFNDAINVVAMRPIGPKERILVVEVGGRQLVVGMTASQVRTLHVFDECVVAGESNTPMESFPDRLRQAMKRLHR